MKAASASGTVSGSLSNTVSKAVFKARALEILRRVQATGEPVIITDRGRPVLRLEPYFGEDDAVLASLRGSVLAYRDPTEPVEAAAWEALA
jgi:prevent-host-death family protein